METYNVSIISESAYHAAAGDSAWNRGIGGLRSKTFASDELSARGENVGLMQASGYAKTLAVRLSKDTELEPMMKLASPAAIRNAVRNQGHAACMVLGSVVVITNAKLEFENDELVDHSIEGSEVARQVRHHADQFSDMMNGKIEAARAMRQLNA